MKLIFLPATVTYHFQLALTNLIHGYAAHRIIPQPAAAWQLVLKHHCFAMLHVCRLASSMRKDTEAFFQPKSCMHGFFQQYYGTCLLM